MPQMYFITVWQIVSVRDTPQNCSTQTVRQKNLNTVLSKQNINPSSNSTVVKQYSQEYLIAGIA